MNLIYAKPEQSTVPALLLNKKHPINVFIIIKITKGEHYGKI